MNAEKDAIEAENVTTEAENVSTGRTNVDNDSKGISYLKYMPSYAYEPKLNKKLPKKQKRPLIKHGPYFLMRTRSLSGKPKSNPRINPR